MLTISLLKSFRNCDNDINVFNFLILAELSRKTPEESKIY